ncbi:MAG TPA: site-2 protease family protein [archaeon]|nr:site-2 protease family protein [archaeon]
MKITFTVTEVKEITIAAAVLSVAFALAYSDGIMHVDTVKFPYMVFYAFVAVGIGFLAHELIGHKIVAQRLGMHGEFRMWRSGLAIALFSSLIGFVFAAPGAVYVAPRYDLWGRAEHISKKKMGLVSIMGPVVNLVLAGAFFALNYYYPSDLFGLAVFVNVWLGIFNMLPIPPLDGSKVFAWDKRIWTALFAVLVAMFVVLL